MTRAVDALLSNEAFARGATNPMLNLSNGGQFGWAPDLANWVSNQAYVPRNLCCVLLEAPKFFQLMPEPQRWVQSLKAMFELHARTIEGFKAGLTVEVAEHAVGGGGEMQQEFTDVKRERSEPTFGFIEKYGAPIQTLLENWIMYGLMSPDTKYAAVGTLGQNAPADMLADWYTASALFYEPDPTHRKVVRAWISTNMFPKGTGEITGKRDQNTAGEIRELSVEFTAVSQYGLGTRVFAQQILDSINLAYANPNNRPAFIQQIAPDVAAAANGYKSGIENLANSTIRP